MTQRDDDRLRETFQALRSETEEARRVPEFSGMLDEARRRAEARPVLQVVAGGQRGRRLMRAGAWASAVLAASVVGLILIDRPPSGDEDFERLVAAYVTGPRATWGSPTSGLLEVPGIDFMRSLPSIGAPIWGVDPGDLPARPSSPEEENL